MCKTRGNVCAILVLVVTVNLSNGYHIGSSVPGSVSGSFSGSSSTSSSFSSASSSSFSGTIGGNLDSQHIGKLVDGLKNGAISSAVAGASAVASAGAYSGSGGCSGDCSGVDASSSNAKTGLDHAKYSASNVNSNAYSGTGLCETCNGPYPGPNGNIHDYKLVSEIQGNSLAPLPAAPTIPTAPVVPHVPVFESSKNVVSHFPGSSGSIYDSKPATSVHAVPSVQTGSHSTSGSYSGSGFGYQAAQGHHNTYSGVAIHKGTSLSPEFIAKLPGAPGSIHDSVASGAHASAGAGAVTGSSLDVNHIPKLPGAPGSIYTNTAVSGGHAATGASAATGTSYHSGSNTVHNVDVSHIPSLPGAPGSIHTSIPATGTPVHPGSSNVGISNVPEKHPLVGPACIWRPGSPPDGCGHAPEIIVPAPQPSVPSPAQPSKSDLGPVSKPNFHLFPGAPGSIHESKPASTGSVSVAGAHSSANAGAHSQIGSYDGSLPAVTGSVPIGKFPGSPAPTVSGSHSVSGSSGFQSGSSNTGSYSEYDLPNQGVYYINTDTNTVSLPSQGLEAPYQHPHAPSFSAQVPCNEDDKNCGIKPISEPAHATEKTPSCIGAHCGGQPQPTPPTPVINIGPSTGSSKGSSSSAHTTAGTDYTSTNQGFQATQYKPFPSAECVNGGSCNGEYPKPHCKNGVCDQPSTGYTHQGQKPFKPVPSQQQPEVKPGLDNEDCQKRGLCGQDTGFATGEILVQNQPDGVYNPYFNEQNKPNKPDNFDCQKRGLCGQDTGYATGQVLIQNQDGTVNNPENQKPNEPIQPDNYDCQTKGLCGQDSGSGTGQILIPNQGGSEYKNQVPQPHNFDCQKRGLCGQDTGYATGQIMIQNQDETAYNPENQNQNAPNQPDNSDCQTRGLCGQHTGYATGQVLIQNQDGSVYNSENTPNQPNNFDCQTRGICGQNTGLGTGHLLISNQGGSENKEQVHGQVPQTPGFATGNVYIQKHDGSKVEVVENSNLATSGQYEHQGGIGGCSSGLCTPGSQSFGGSGFATGQVVVHKNDGSVNDITNSACPGGNCVTGSGTGSYGGSYGNTGSYSSGQSSSYGSGDGYSSDKKYGCLTGACGNSGTGSYNKGSYSSGGSRFGSLSGSGSYASGHNHGSILQPYGALSGSKFHGGAGAGSYAGSSASAFSSSGSFGPVSQSFGLSRLTDASSNHGGAVAGSFAKAGSYAGAGSSAGSYASSFARSY